MAVSRTNIITPIFNEYEMVDEITPEWIIYGNFFVLGITIGGALPVTASMIPSISYNTRVMKTLLPILVSSISIIFLVLTFLLAEYARSDLDTEKRPFAIGTLIMSVVLVLATLSFVIGVVAFWSKSAIAFTISVLLFGSEILLLVIGIAWLSYQVVGPDAIMEAINHYVE